ncbi:hypothetical protein IWW34DRAFT_154295 [Fusarium oxysporum f. sp. albedinis]|nr:hypothetical protein IWW34DRAFT_154295 [Fusarium oxysporum f. sp. albedinis]
MFLVFIVFPLHVVPSISHHPHRAAPNPSPTGILLFASPWPSKMKACEALVPSDGLSRGWSFRRSRYIACILIGLLCSSSS